MTTWNYQLAHKKHESGVTLYGMVEVYRNKEGEILATTENFVSPNEWDSAGEVIGTLKMMLKDAQEYPVLDLDNLQCLGFDE